MLKLAGLLAVSLLLVFATPAAAHTLLMRPDGQRVGGVWQRWVNETRVPTVSGRVELMDSSICQGAQGCSRYYPALHAAVLHAHDRAALYFELGNLYDWENLTWHDRGILAHIWGVSGHAWSDSNAALAAGREDGLQVDFDVAYQQCAMGDRVSGLAAGGAPAIRMGDTCALIRRFVR